MALLEATPATVIVDEEAGEQGGTTEVHYEKERDHLIWERKDWGDWVEHAVLAARPTDTAHRRGSFESLELAPGSVYETIVLEAGRDANEDDADRRPEARLTVGALRKRPEERPLIRDHSDNEGGTWCANKVVTEMPVVAVLQVSSEAPKVGEHNFLSFDSVGGEAWSEEATTHNIEIRGLLPGNSYHELLRVSDKYGNWEFRQRQFTALRRTLTAELVDIRVHDDGDDGLFGGTGEGAFFLALQAGTERRLIQYDNSDFDDQTTLHVGRSVTLGPERVSPEGRDARLEAWGIESNEGAFPFVGDDYSNYATLELHLPQGRNHEVTHTAGPVGIRSTPDDDFTFTAYVNWAVDYEP